MQLENAIVRYAGVAAGGAVTFGAIGSFFGLVFPFAAVGTLFGLFIARCKRKRPSASRRALSSIAKGLPPAQSIASEIVNCQTCGTGKSLWHGNVCPSCGGDPLIENSGREDWYDWSRAKMIARFGPRIDGDAELLEKYRDDDAVKWHLENGYVRTRPCN